MSDRAGEAASETAARGTLPYTIFLLSPANLSGERARYVFNPLATFETARRLHSDEGAPLGEVFAFVSGLYFRGKKAYAEAFGRPPPELPGGGGLVISAGGGLRFLHERVTLAQLRTWEKVDIDESNRRFTAPLIEHAEALERAHGADTRFVLLGSVASDKYVRPLMRVFGDHLLFPPAFVGRGDMSRGAMMLRAAREGVELGYAPIEGAARHGPRAASVAQKRNGSGTGDGRQATGDRRQAMSENGTATAEGKEGQVELVLLVGLPGAGKSTFYAQRFAGTHVQVSKDLLRAGRRAAGEQVALVRAALGSGRSVVVDNTNASVAERAALVAEARRVGARVTAYYFDCPPRDCLARNAGREGRARVPKVAIFATAKRLVAPAAAEGFDELHVVRAFPELIFEIDGAPG